MDLQILVSKKGTQVVTATNLHAALQLPPHKYNKNVEKWLIDIYAFKDDIRQPDDLKDFAHRNLKYSKQKDYYFSLEMAKLITLKSDSPVKLPIARHLSSLDVSADEKQSEFLTKDQVVAVLELTKVMGMMSCQYSVEKEHQRRYEENKGLTYDWWKYRADILGYSVEKLREEMATIGKSYKGKNMRQMLLQVDRYEVIRMSVIDLFIALGKSVEYAKNMGDLAKVFAKEMDVEIWDDRKGDMNVFQSNINPTVINEIKSFQKDSILSLW